MLSVWEAPPGGRRASGKNCLVPALDGGGTSPHRLLADFVEVRPEVMALHAINSEIDGKTDHVGELPRRSLRRT
ncbi:MAG: hypothetical protein R3B13_38040 [Polyangiaceae bacterium]